MLEEGALPAQIDRAIEKFGFAMGPFRVSDLAGNDIGWAIRKRLYRSIRICIISRIADRLCEIGRFGQKTGAGWYDYKPGDRSRHSVRSRSPRSCWRNPSARAEAPQGERRGDRRALRSIL